MFTQNKLKMDSLAEAVAQVMEKSELDETGLRKAAYAAHKSGQTHFEFQGKKYPVKVQGEEVMAGKSIEEASVKVSTATGMKVYGGAKGGSAKAYLKQKYGDDLDDIHGPSDKDLEAIKHEKKKKKEVDLDEGKMGQLSADLKDLSHDDFHKEYGKPKSHYDPTNFKKPVQPGKEMDRAKSLAQRGVASMKKEDTSFASRLLQSIREGKGNQPQETFTDNNMGEEMSSAQMKKREKIVMSMKDKTAEFKAKYGKDWKKVMYATATKMAMKEETIYEEEVVTKATAPGRVTTDMLTGRVEFGKSNSFKPYKLQLRTDGEMKSPQTEEPAETREKQKISTNPGPVDIKLDDKLTGPTPYTHFANEKSINSGIKTEAVSKLLSKIRKNTEKIHKDDIADFKSKIVQAKEEVEYYEINEEKPEHTHVAHFEDKNGQWMAKLLINADHDGHAIDQANEASGKGPFGGLNVRKVERVTKVMEDVKLDGESWKKETDWTPSKNKNPRGVVTNLSDKARKETEKSYKDKDVKEDTTPPFEGPYTPAKGDVKDKSGAKHTPMSRAKDLAKKAMKNVGKSLNKETMMGKAGTTSEEVESLDEDNLLDTYISSLGMEPKNVPKSKKIGYANSTNFLRWKQTHQ
jgi:hypothetical protein